VIAGIDMKPKVINLFTRMGAGGPPTQALHLLKELPQYGFESVLAAGRCEDGENDMHYLLDSKHQIRDIPHLARSVSLMRDAQALWLLYSFFKSERPHIVHTHTAKAGILGRVAAWAAGVPCIVHTFHGNVLSGYFPGSVNLAIRCIERLIAALTDRICVLSPQQFQDVVNVHRIAAPSKVSIVRLGLDLTEFYSLPLPAATGEIVVGWLGRLVPIKDIPLLCAVVRQVTATLKNVRFMIAGDGPQRNLIADLVRDVGERRCSFVGWQQNVGPIIRNCHLLIQTSRNEGTPVALIQGLAAGRPFLSTPAGGVVDLAIGEDYHRTAGASWRENAVLVPPRPQAFTHAITEFVSNPGILPLMAEQARKSAAPYSLDNFLRELKQVYHSVLSQSGHEAGAPAASTDATTASAR
jgi:glycosyltransferase involved in cell wall biosynthesis